MSGTAYTPAAVTRAEAAFAALIGWMYYQVAHVPGGQAIGALESWFAKIAKRLGRLFGRKQPRREAEASPPADPPLPDPIPAE